MLHLYRAPRLDQLLATLAGIIVQPPADALTPELIVVQHRDLARYFAQGLAELHGIAANLEFVLPSQLSERIFSAHCGKRPPSSLFGQEILPWRINTLLGELKEQPGCEEVAAYLRSDIDGRKGYQLAVKVSELLARYQLYRPDLLLGWERGTEQNWQALLWRMLAAEQAEEHPGRLLQRLRTLQAQGRLKGGFLPERIVLAGLNGLPPLHLELIALLATVREVHLLQLGAQESRRPGSTGTNPLRASLTDMSAQFTAQLAGLDCVTHAVAEPAPPLAGTTATLLGWLQEDLITGRDRSLAGGEKQLIAAPDRSLQFHICHSRLREVQILHDRLLELFETHRELRPGEILVMAPDIEAYVPAIAGVFDSAPKGQRLPWAIADRPYSSEHPTARAFLDLLDLLGGRFSLSAVLALLETPAVLQRFGLDEAGLIRLRDWVRQSNIRWGLDQQQRHALGLAQSHHNTWSFGLERLFLGYLTGSETAIYQEISPWPAVRDSEANLLGALAQFLERLTHYRPLLKQEHTPAQWSAQLLALLDDFFAAGAEDDGDPVNTIRASIHALRDQCGLAGFTRPLGAAVLTSQLAAMLGESGGGGAFLSGRITFAAMVPGRCPPARVIWLLGLTDRDFPRRSQPLAFDLMAQSPRPGDRDQRQEDRAFFCECLLAARQYLAISWVGRDQHNNGESPPAVVVDELRDYLRHSFRAAHSELLAQLSYEYPLQPFSPRCFDPSLAGRSFASQWLPTPSAAPRPFVGAPLAPPEEQWRQVDLKDLTRFWSQPVRFFLQERLGLQLWEEDALLVDSEPFALDARERYQLQLRITEELRRGTPREELARRLRGSGSLPHHGFGDNALHELLDQGQAMCDRLAQLATSRREALELRLDITSENEKFQLRGRLSSLWDSGRLTYRPATLKARDLLNLWVNHLALNLVARDHELLARSFHLALDKTITLTPVAEPQRHLTELLTLYWQGLREPLHFYPKTSHAYCTAKPGSELSAAHKAWHGGFNTAGEGEEQAYRIALAGTTALDAHFVRLTQVYAPLFEHLEDLSATP